MTINLFSFSACSEFRRLVQWFVLVFSAFVQGTQLTKKICCQGFVLNTWTDLTIPLARVNLTLRILLLQHQCPQREFNVDGKIPSEYADFEK